MIKDLFKKFADVIGIAEDKKAAADQFIASLPDDLGAGGSKKVEAANEGKSLTAEDMQKLIADALTKQAQTFATELEKMKVGQQGEKVEQAIKKLIDERRIAPKDEEGIKQAKALLTADYESGLAVLSKVPQVAPEKPATAPKTDDSMKKTIQQTDAGRSLDQHLLAHVANIPSITE